MEAAERSGQLLCRKARRSLSNARGRLLVVDDFDMNREALSRRLRKSGFEVEEADHGSKVLPMVEGSSFDLILLDIMMPGIDGIEVLKSLRTRFSKTDLPVIILSAKEDRNIQVEAFKHGANDFVAKPIDFPVTLARIESLLMHRGSRQENATQASRPAPPVPRSSATVVGSVPMPEELPPGTRVGSYELTRTLGRGGMGVVYEAIHQDLGRRTALKLMKKDADPAWEARLRREARAAARIDHPNVVAIYEVGVWQGHFFIAMQLAEGEALSAILKQKGQLPWQEATRIMAAVCRGLGAAHSGGVLHRDIKPDNVMIGGEGQVKLLDFGIAKLADTPPDEEQTQMGTIIGTPHFMSPEQCRYTPLDARSDVYQVGATYYMLLTGKRPYSHHPNLFEVMQAHCHEAPPDPRQAAPDVPEACSVIIARAMAKAPADRYASASDMADALEKLLSG